MEILKAALLIVIGYLLGSLNSALLVGRLYGKDVRQYGSGNAGLTNAYRVLGKGAAALTALGDILKAIIACVAGYLIMGDAGAVWAGAAAVVGHNWPLYFGFKGGKGALSSISVIFFLDWRIGLLLVAVFLVVVLLTRYVSAGSLIAAALFPVLAVFFGEGTLFVLFSLFIAALVILRHRSNIMRLVKGQEPKLEFGKR